jgi:very-short-patch-repair endonuclease
MRVIRFENCEVMENLERVLEAIRAVLDQHHPGASRHPSSAEEGKGPG